MKLDCCEPDNNTLFKGRLDTEYAVIDSLIKTITEITGSTFQYESLKFALDITGRNALKLLNAV